MKIEVLLVDDDKDLLEIASRYLEQSEEIRVTTASSVDDALKTLNENAFDLIVSDYQMPAKTGLEFLELLREDNNLIPFIVFTGRSREEVAIRALNLGATFYITKGGPPKAQYTELTHMIKSAVRTRKITEELQKSEERYRHILESTFEGILIHSSGTILKISQSILHIFGLQYDVIGKHISEFVDIERSNWRKLLESKIETKEEIELQISGREVIVEIVSQPTTYKNHSASIWAINDITSERKQEEEYHREKAAFQIIAEATTIKSSLNEVCTYVLSGLAKILNFQNGSIGLRKQNSDILELIAFYGSDVEESDVKAHSIHNSERLAAYVARTGEYIFAPEIKQHPIYETHHGRIDHRGIKSLISWPLYREDNSIWGVVQLWAEERRKLVSADKSFFETIAKMFQSVITQKEAQDAKYRSEQKYREVIEQTRQPIVILQDHRIVLTNQAFSDLVGYSLEDLYSLPREELLIHPDDRKVVLSRDHERLRGKTFETPLSFRLLSKSGSTIWVESHANAIDYEGSHAIQIAYFDITSRKSVEETLNRERLSIRVIAEAALIAESTNHLGRLVVSGLAKLLKFDFSSFRLYNPSTKILELEATYGVQDDSLLGSKPLSDETSIQSYSARERVAIFANSIYEHPLCKEKILRFEKFGITSYTTLPILKGEGELLGVLSFGSRIPRQFNEREKVFFENIVRMFATAISRQEVETALQESARKYKELIENSVIGFCILQNERYVFVNQAFANITGRLIEDLLSFTPDERRKICHQEDSPILEERYKKRIRGIPTSSNTRFRYIRPSGEIRWVEGYSHPSIYNNEPAIQVQILDITEQIISQKLLMRQKEELSEFAHAMSHDLQTYFHNIFGYAVLLEEEYTPKYIEAIKRSIRSMEKLLSRSIELADSGLVIGDRINVDLNTLIQHAAKEILPEDIIFEMDALPSVKCDYQKIDQVVRNILNNAVEHANPRLIRVSVGEEKDSLTLSFCNDGDSIPPEYHDKLFMYKFSTKKKGGMGLRIVKRIIDAHNWSIRLDIGDMTCFTILIPIEDCISNN
ncbi:MAG: putative Histidine kinase [Candidatus Thorarchaeota archaeon]|nr:MAG: putative Histidine kinase [Candidatus Thorarchaeota archaeon]